MKAGNTVWSLTNLDLLKVLFLVELALAERDSKAACKRTQHCWPTTPNIVACYMLRPLVHPVACCWMLLRVVAQSLTPVKLFSQQLPTFLLFRDRRSVAQQCWIRLHSSSNIVGATHAHYTWSPKSHGLDPSHNALQVPTLLGVVASFCTPLPTRTQQCANNVGSCSRSLNMQAFHFFRLL